MSCWCSDARPVSRQYPELPCPSSRWFRAQGVPVKLIRHTAKPEVTVKRKLQLTKAQSGPDRISSRHQADQTPASLQPARLLLCDFDKTIADFDAGESAAGFFGSKHQIKQEYTLCFRASQQYAMTCIKLVASCAYSM